MNVLLDSHAIILFSQNSPKLSTQEISMYKEK